MKCFLTILLCCFAFAVNGIAAEPTWHPEQWNLGIIDNEITNTYTNQELTEQLQLCIAKKKFKNNAEKSRLLKSIKKLEDENNSLDIKIKNCEFEKNLNINLKLPIILTTLKGVVDSTTKNLDTTKQNLKECQDSACKTSTLDTCQQEVLDKNNDITKNKAENALLKTKLAELEAKRDAAATNVNCELEKTRLVADCAQQENGILKEKEELSAERDDTRDTILKIIKATTLKVQQLNAQVRHCMKYAIMKYP